MKHSKGSERKRPTLEDFADEPEERTRMARPPKMSYYMKKKLEKLQAETAEPEAKSKQPYQRKLRYDEKKKLEAQAAPKIVNKDPVLCVGGPLAGTKVPHDKAERTYQGYVMREIKKPNPELYVAAPESVWVYVPQTLEKNDSLTLYLLDLYQQLLYK